MVHTTYYECYILAKLENSNINKEKAIAIALLVLKVKKEFNDHERLNSVVTTVVVVAAD